MGEDVKGVPFEDDELYNADPNCNHEYNPSGLNGIRCIKCGGWSCY